MAIFQHLLWIFFLIFSIFVISKAEYRAFTYVKGNGTANLNENCPEKTTLNGVGSEISCARKCAEQECQMIQYERESDICHLYGQMNECLMDNRLWHKAKEFHNSPSNMTCSMVYRGEFCERSLMTLGRQLPMDFYHNDNVSMIDGRSETGIVTQPAHLTTDAKFDKALELDGGFVSFGLMDETCVSDWDSAPDCQFSFSMAFMLKVLEAPPLGDTHYVLSIGRSHQDVSHAVAFVVKPEIASIDTYVPDFLIRRQGKYYRVNLEDQSMSIYTWHHYALIFDGMDGNGVNFVSILVDGAELATVSSEESVYAVNTALGPSPLVFGAMSGNTGDFDSRARVIIDDFLLLDGKPDLNLLQNLYKTPNYGLV